CDATQRRAGVGIRQAPAAPGVRSPGSAGAHAEACRGRSARHPGVLASAGQLIAHSQAARRETAGTAGRGTSTYLNSKTNSLNPRQDAHGGGGRELVHAAQGSGSGPRVRDLRAWAGAIAAVWWQQLVKKRELALRATTAKLPPSEGFSSGDNRGRTHCPPFSYSLTDGRNATDVGRLIESAAFRLTRAAAGVAGTGL